jgi:hypothetical protein
MTWFRDSMAARRETWVTVNLWRVFLQTAALNIGLVVWLIASVVTHNTNSTWASALFLGLLALPQFIGWIMVLSREPLRSRLFRRYGPDAGEEAPRGSHGELGGTATAPADDDARHSEPDKPSTS